MLQLSPHPELHPVFEALAYVMGFVEYRRADRRTQDVIENRQRWNVIAGAMAGGLAGSRILGLLEQLPLQRLTFLQILSPGSGGKTIVGGLLGGWLGVELVKKLSGITTRTGDLFALALCVGIAVGRIGCLLAGLADGTYGNPTSLWWGVNFGDGIVRHPVQAYEIVFLSLLAIALRKMEKLPHQDGALFRVFMIGYLGWRLLIDFLKPEPLVNGLSIIQWACLLGLFLLIITWRRGSGTVKSGQAREYG